jgi:hypothetical protein
VPRPRPSPWSSNITRNSSDKSAGKTSNGYGSYPSAWLAPPSVQDAKAAENVTGILAAHDNDVTAVPVVWYIGHVPPAGSPAWDTVPYPAAGNTLTPRQYQARWLATHRHITDASLPADVKCALPGGRGEVIAEGWALPGPRALLDTTVDQLDDPHHDYPAWDWLIPEGTPIYAIRGGVVDRISTWNQNWWTAGCGTVGGGDCTSCGVGLTIVDAADTRWIYCHGSQLHVTLGQTVVAGEQILTSGNTGRSGTPHLHLEINACGHRRCPQPLVLWLYRSSVAIDVSALPAGGCTFGT